jgi:hypothetical protein
LVQLPWAKDQDSYQQESPVTICTTDTIGTIRSQRLFQVLFDSASNVSIIKRSALLKGVITKLLGNTKLVRALSGCLKMQEVVTVQDIRLPEFNKNRRINQQKVLVLDSNNVKYIIIQGTNSLSKTGIKLNYSEGNMAWIDCSIPLCPPGGLDSNKFDTMKNMLHTQVKDKLFCEDWLECFATEILDPKYEMTDVVEIVRGLTHLNAHQKADLLRVLRKTTRCLIELLEFIHTKRYTLTLIQMPSLYILGHILYLESIQRLPKRNSPILLELVF